MMRPTEGDAARACARHMHRALDLSGILDRGAVCGASGMRTALFLSPETPMHFGTVQFASGQDHGTKDAALCEAR